MNKFEDKATPKMAVTTTGIVRPKTIKPKPIVTTKHVIGHIKVTVPKSSATTNKTTTTKKLVGHSNLVGPKILAIPSKLGGPKRIEAKIPKNEI